MISYSIYNIPEIEKIGVYAIRNARTNRYYVGSTVNIYNRFLLHSRDIRKAGGINRKMQEDCETNEEFE
ncbi:MAG: GIY-YIG nuclease family protein, partial [Oscillospiraceae bacterium]|nr:GIY-YIG nuclease family protein [Oscillospiraceae bacterium]